VNIFATSPNKLCKISKVKDSRWKHCHITTEFVVKVMNVSICSAYNIVHDQMNFRKFALNGLLGV